MTASEKTNKNQKGRTEGQPECPGEENGLDRYYHHSEKKISIKISGENFIRVERHDFQHAQRRGSKKKKKKRILNKWKRENNGGGGGEDVNLFFFCFVFNFFKYDKLKRKKGRAEQHECRVTRRESFIIIFFFFFAGSPPTDFKSCEPHFR